MRTLRRWRWALDPRDPDFEEPPARHDDDPDPPDEPIDDPRWLGPPDYEGTARYPR